MATTETVKQRDDDPFENMWTMYLTQAEKHNKVLLECWRSDMSSILIFAGLFSGSLTTFLIQSYQSLAGPPPDPSETTINLALQLSKIILTQSGSNVTFPALSLPVQTATPFVPPTPALICNTLWFLSLAFSLTCALFATLVDQWVRNYVLATESLPSLSKRARISAYLHRGLRTFYLNVMVDLIPTLLHISLLLFFAGLVFFLYPVNAWLSNLMLSVLVICTCLYALLTFLPLFYTNCPYHTPLSNGWWRILRAVGVVGHAQYDVNIPKVETMAEARIADAITTTPERDQRDLEAMEWALAVSREDSELEPFVDFIPQLVAGFDYSAKLLLHRLLHHQNPTISLSYRIPRFLSSCGEVRSPSLAEKRATTCIHAIWSLTMMTVPLSVPFADEMRSGLPFDGETLNRLHGIRMQLPAVSGSVHSAAAVIARNVLDLQMDRVAALAAEISEFLRSGHWSQRRPSPEANSGWYDSRTSHAKKKVEEHLISLEQTTAADKCTHPFMYILINTVRHALDDLADVISVTGDISLAEEAMEYIQRFQEMLRHIGFLLILNFISILVRSPTLPFEAFSTLRRLFLKANVDSDKYPVQSQSLLLTLLEEALDRHPSRETRLPASIINLILGLAASALEDSAVATKAHSSISQYIDLVPLPLTHDTAMKALTKFDQSLPRTMKAHPASDLLRMHIYANTKITPGRSVS